MTRGAIYVYWGSKFEAELQRSIDSLKRYHPELPIEVFKLPDNSTLLDKAAMMDKTPFESTVFLDTDTVVLGRLDFGFEKAEKFGLACCICECPWARRYGGLSGDTIEYNTGVLFFTKQSKPVFDGWKANAGTVDSSIRMNLRGSIGVMPHNDQAGFAKAVEDTGYNPFVLPLNWNMRPMWHKTYFGPIKIWHDHSEVPDWLHMWNERQRLEQSIIRYSEGN
jgi:hypothetical protein